VAQRIKPVKGNLPGQERGPSAAQRRSANARRPYDPAEAALRRLGREARHVGNRARDIGDRVLGAINPFD
jgi:hypothetical protein